MNCPNCGAPLCLDRFCSYCRSHVLPPGADPAKFLEELVLDLPAGAPLPAFVVEQLARLPARTRRRIRYLLVQKGFTTS